jgi:Secretion system C-terminal sorting domain/Fibronectin type III domain
MNLRYPPFVGKINFLLTLAFAFFLGSTYARPFDTINNEPTTVCSLCNIPNAPSSLNVTDTQVTFIWDAGFDACTYTTRYREKGTTTWITNTMTSNAVFISGLLPGKNYEWQVRTNCCDGSFSGYTPLASFTTAAACTNLPPTGLISSNIASFSATLSWNGISGATYLLKYKIQGSSSWQSVNVNTNSYSVSGLLASTPYEFQVSTYLNGCVGAPSTTATFTTISTATCGTVGKPTLVSFSPNSACIQWTPISQVCSYTVRARVVGTTTWTSVQYTSLSQICISSLLANTNYECQVAANCCNGAIGAFSILLPFSTNSTCTAPINPTASAITSTTAQLCWAGSTGASGYIVEYKTSAATTWTSVTTTATCTTLFGLSANTTYQYRVSTICNGGAQSSACTVSTFTTTNMVTCDIPTNITCSNQTSSGFLINWPAVAGACSYNIRLRVLGATTWAFTGPLSSNKATVNNASPGTIYEFQIQSVCCNGGTSDFSVLCTCQTTAFCPTPTGVSISSITNTNATVSWAAATGATSYTVQYSPVGSTTWASVSSTTNSTILYGLTPNTAYQVQVVSNCPNNCVSAASTITTFTTTNTTTASCGIPINCSFNTVTATSCGISWAAVTGACSYIVRVRVQGTTIWAATGTATKNGATLTGLTPNTTYEWQVLSVCCTGVQGDYCPIQIVTTSNSCATPTNVIATNVSSSSANLSWLAVSGAAAYTVYYKSVNQTLWNSLITTTNSFLIANLAPATTYQFYVKTTCSPTSESGPSTICIFTTTAAITCEIPLGLTAQNVTTNSATLSWISAPSACSYKVRYRNVGSATWITVTAASNSLAISGLTTGTAYEWNVMSVCCNNSTSLFSNNANFTTNTACLTNDEPCTPTVINVGQTSWTCVNGSNLCATGSTVVDPTGCSYSPNDVWYKLIMPSSGLTTIAVCANAGMNPGIAVYANNGCGKLYYLGCKYTTNTGTATGAVAQISVQGPAGCSLWIRVWGGANTTGLFNICAINQLICANAKPTAETRTDSKADIVIPENNSNDISLTNHTLSIFPNPAYSTINVKFDALENNTQSNIVVYDLQGRKIQSEKIEIQKGENETQLSVENISNGTYILRIESAENFAPSRLIIQK